MKPENPQMGAIARRRGRSLNGLALQIGAVALSFILIAILVVTSSRAAFVAQNDNTANRVTSASILLTDNDNGTAMFDNLTGLMPLSPVTKCIDVTYTGDINPTAVKLYAAGTPTGTLAPYLNLTIEIGTDTTPAFGDCTGFAPSSTLYNTGTLADFASTKTDFTSGLTTWTPSIPGQTRTFRFTLTVQDNNTAANKTTSFGFSWETRSS